MSEIYYLDHCGSTPLNKNVKDFLKSDRVLDAFGNPSAVHHKRGEDSRQLVEDARSVTAAEFGVEPGQVFFTGGASEANNIIIQGFWFRFKDRGCRVVCSSIEHKSVLDATLRVGELTNSQSFLIPVDPRGILDLERLRAVLKENPKSSPTLVSVMHTNNEIPVRQPVEKIAELCEEYGAYFHCDAVQGFIRSQISFKETNYGSVVVSPHKFYGPKGCGILVVGKSATAPVFLPLSVGGEQESGVRPGTLNTWAIAGAGVALTEHVSTRSTLRDFLRSCDETFISLMNVHVPNFKLTVPRCDDAPGIVNFYIEGWDAPSLLSKLKKTCINRGASCTGAGGEKFSHVPRALGLPLEIQANVMRASFGWGCNLQDIANAVHEISVAVK
jgi:cysteine desulfurase